MDTKYFIENFENPSLENRIDLIEDSNWRENDEILDYITMKLKTFTPTTNEWFNVLMIELLEELNLIDNSTLDKLITILNNKNHYLLKISVLDSFQNLNNTQAKSNVLKVCLGSLTRNKRERLIVRVQAILLMKYFKWESNDYDQLLVSYVKKSNDHRLHIRLFEYLMDFGFDLLDENIFKIIFEESTRKNLGTALKKTLNEVNEKNRSV